MCVLRSRRIGWGPSLYSVFEVFSAKLWCAIFCHPMSDSSLFHLTSLYSLSMWKQPSPGSKVQRGRAAPERHYSSTLPKLKRYQSLGQCGNCDFMLLVQGVPAAPPSFSHPPPKLVPGWFSLSPPPPLTNATVGREGEGPHLMAYLFLLALQGSQ